MASLGFVSLAFEKLVKLSWWSRICLLLRGGALAMAAMCSGYTYLCSLSTDIDD